MPALAPPRIPLPPTVRRALGALALVAGVVLVGQQLRGNAPREVEIHLPLRPLVRAGYTPRAVEITLSRGTTTLRSLERRFTGGVPGDLVEVLALPAGRAHAHVAVTLDDRVVSLDVNVTVPSGGTLALECPPAPVFEPSPGTFPGAFPGTSSGALP